MSEFDVFAEYKLFVEDTARFSERRQTVSNIYVAVNTLLLTAIGLLAKDIASGHISTCVLVLPLIVAGLAVSALWRQLVLKYKRLVGLRIDVLRFLELQDGMTGSVQMYHREDELYPRDDTGAVVPRGGPGFSDLEGRLPVLFAVLYVLFGLFCVVSALVLLVRSCLGLALLSS